VPFRNCYTSQSHRTADVSNFLRKATPELGPRAKVKSAAPGEQEEQTDEQEDDAAMPR